MDQKVEKIKMSKYRPTMNFSKAKLLLGINPALHLSQLNHEDVHSKFINKCLLVNEDQVVDSRTIHEAYQFLSRNIKSRKNRRSRESLEVKLTEKSTIRKSNSFSEAY